MKIGYARVSTFEQNLDMQLDALNKDGCQQVFTDKVSGIKSSKPAFERLFEYARPGDTLSSETRPSGEEYSKADRTGGRAGKKRNKPKIIGRTGRYNHSYGKPLFQFMCILAEHERNIIGERTKAGLSSARARGRTGGRPKGLSPRFRLIASEIKEMYERDNRSTEEIRKIFGIKSQPKNLQ